MYHENMPKDSMSSWFNISRAAAPEKKKQSAYTKTKAKTNFAETVKLISVFVFTTWIVQFLFFLNLKFQASSYFL